MRARLGRISIPVTAFHGVGDVIPCDETLAFLTGAITQLRAVRIERAGHFPWLEPQARAAFLEELQGAISEGERVMSE